MIKEKLDKVEKLVNSELSSKISGSEIVFEELLFKTSTNEIIDVIKFLKLDERLKFKQLIDITAIDYPSKEKRFESWSRKFRNELSIDSATPNEGHKKIAEIMKVKDSFLVTQNVDNLHQDSGVDIDKIAELHGNATYAKCLDCSRRYELEDLKKEFLETNEPPLCSICGGILKTATISFGQAMPEKEMQISQKKAIESDLFICIGTSLAVFPAADLPLLAKETGATLVILNNEPTQMDQLVDLVINKDISEVFSEISL